MNIPVVAAEPILEQLWSSSGSHFSWLSQAERGHVWHVRATSMFIFVIGAMRPREHC